EAATDDGWVIRRFDATYTISPDGSVQAVEDLQVDFGTVEKHGIFREIPIRYRYDAKRDRQISIEQITIEQNGRGAQWEEQKSDANLRLKIGRASETVSGIQRYTISYTIRGGLNSFDDHDELFLNVTGNGWPVQIQNASAR